MRAIIIGLSQSLVLINTHDICESKRALAVEFGAKEVGRKEFVAIARKQSIVKK